MTQVSVITLRSKEYRIAVDHITHRDGSVSTVVLCNGSLAGAPLFPERKMPKAIQKALASVSP